MSDTSIREGTWFERNPVKTLTAVVLAFVILADVVLFRISLDPKTFSFRSKHPYYHHTLVPNFEGTARWGDIEYPFFTNSLGFRDRAARPVALNPSGKRIVFIGDSVIESMGVPHEESFIGLLENMQGNNKTELLNAAVLSYSPKIYYLKMKYLLEQVGLRFDELFVFIDISDVQDEIRYKSFTPRLPRLWNRLLLEVESGLYRHSFIYHSAYETLIRPSEKRIVTIFDFQRWAYWDVAISGLSYSAEDRRKMEAVPRDENGRWLWTFDPETFRQWGEEGLGLAGGYMADLARLCRDHNIRLSIVVYPAPPQIYARDLDSLQVRYWEKFARENAVDFVNLFPAFIDPRGPDPETVYKKYFILSDTHFNPEGHRYLAGLLAGHLSSRSNSR